MKIIVLHGDNYLTSYKRKNSFIKAAKKRNMQVKKLLTGNKLSISEEITQNTLFDGDILYILDNYFDLNKKDIVWLEKNSKNYEGNLVLYSNKAIRETIFKKFPKPLVFEEFKLPKHIFKFLESFYPGNSKSSLAILHSMQNVENINFIFVMLSRHLRDLYFVKKSPSKIPYPSWRVSKLENQSSKFSAAKIKKIIQKMASIDVLIKTSNSKLSDHLDLLIIKQLK